MSNDASDLEGLFARLKAAAERPPESAYESAYVERLEEVRRVGLSQVAQVRAFDEALYSDVVEPGTKMSFGEFVQQAPIERFGKSHYRVRPEYVEPLLEGTSKGELKARLIEYYTGHDNLLEAAYHRVDADPEGLTEQLESLFQSALEDFDTARAQDVLRVLEGRRLTRELDTLRDSMKRRLQAQSLWAGAHWQTLWYQARAQDEELVDALFDDAPEWIVQLHAPGGTGKTMFLRHLVARVCLPKFVPCALIDFDVNAEATVAAINEPSRLLVQMAEQLQEQLLSPTLGAILRDHGQLTEPLRWEGGSAVEPREGAQREIIDRLGGAFKSVESQRVLLMFDTFENVLHNQVNPLRLLELLRRLHEASPKVRVVLSGRFRLDQKRTTPTPGGGSGAGERVRDFEARFGEATRTIELELWSELDAQGYLERRGLEDHPLRDLLVQRATKDCPDQHKRLVNPFLLALLVDLLADDPDLAREDLEEQPVDLVYVVLRILARIEEGARWLLRYGTVARRLTLGFVQEVLLPLKNQLPEDPDQLERTSKQHEVELELPDGSEGDPFTLWSRLFEYAARSSWVSVADGPIPAVVLHEEIRGPLRRVLREERRGAWDLLHERAVEHWRQRALEASNPAERALAWQEATFHLYQRHFDSRSEADALWSDWLAEVDDPQGALNLSRQVLESTDDPEALLRASVEAALAQLELEPGAHSAEKARHFLEQASDVQTTNTRLGDRLALAEAATTWYVDRDLAAIDSLPKVESDVDPDTWLRGELLRADAAATEGRGKGVTTIERAWRFAERNGHRLAYALGDRLAAVRQLRGNLLKASRVRRRLMSVAGSDPLDQFEPLVRLELELGRFDKALDVIEELSGSLGQGFPLWHRMFAAWFLAQLDTVGAHGELIQALESQPHSNERPEQEALMAQLYALRLDHEQASAAWAASRHSSDRTALARSIEEAVFCLEETFELHRALDLLDRPFEPWWPEAFDLAMVHRRLAIARSEPAMELPRASTPRQRLIRMLQLLSEGGSLGGGAFLKALKSIQSAPGRLLALRQLRRCPTNCLKRVRSGVEDLLTPAFDASSHVTLQLVQVEVLRCTGEHERAVGAWERLQTRVEAGPLRAILEIRRAADRLDLLPGPLQLPAPEEESESNLRGVIHLEEARRLAEHGDAKGAWLQIVEAEERLGTDSVWVHHLHAVHAAVLRDLQDPRAQDLAEQARLGFESLGWSGSAESDPPAVNKDAELTPTPDGWKIRTERQEFLLCEPDTLRLVEAFRAEPQLAIHRAARALAEGDLPHRLQSVLEPLEGSVRLTIGRDAAWLPWELSEKQLVRATRGRPDSDRSKGVVLLASLEPEESQDLQEIYRRVQTEPLPARNRLYRSLKRIRPRVVHLRCTLSIARRGEPLLTLTEPYERLEQDQSPFIWDPWALAKELMSAAETAPLVVLDLYDPGGDLERARQLLLRNRFTDRLVKANRKVAVLGLGPMHYHARSEALQRFVEALAGGTTEQSLMNAVRGDQASGDPWGAGSAALFTSNSLRHVDVHRGMDEMRATW